MTDKDKAIQEGERIAAADEYFAARTWIMDTNDNRRIFEAGFDRAYDLLSKLRAPVADERAAFDEWVFQRVQSEQEYSLFDIWMARAALASAPVAGEAVAALIRERRYLGKGVNGKHFYSDFSEWFPATVGHAKAVTSPNRNELGTWEVRWLVDAAPQASAVAGEAQPVAYQVRHLPASPEWFGCDRAAYDVVRETRPKDARALYAAPQASEAQCSCPSGDGSLRHPCAVHPGGEAVRYVAEPNHCRCHPETCCCKDYQVRDTHGKEPKITVFDLDEAQQLARSLNRAALSAQPGAQKTGGSDAN